MFGKYFNSVRRHFGYGKGAAAGTGIVAKEYGIAGAIQRTELIFTNAPIVVANTTGASFGSQKIYDFPLGVIYLIGGRANLTFNWSAEGIVQTGSGDFSLGSTATADATLGSTDVDMMASTAMLDPFVAGVGTGKGNLVKNTEFDGSATAKDMFFNAIIDDADVSDEDSDTVLINGIIVFTWTNHGV